MPPVSRHLSIARLARHRLRAMACSTLLLSSQASPSHDAWAQTSTPLPTLDGGAIASADHFGTEAGQRILRDGGNAVDAAVAVAFALAVTYPEAGNIGGGGFMTLFMNGTPYFLDYREQAPKNALRTVYLDNTGAAIPESALVGSGAVCVPGTVAGMWEAHRRFGALQWKDVLAPAVEFARLGFRVDSRKQRRAGDAIARFSGRTNFSQYFSALKEDADFVQPELAAALTRIAESGARGFYHGETAARIVTTLRPNGVITEADLHAYKPVWRTPLMTDWQGYQLISAPPPSSGGIGLFQMLHMKEHLADAFATWPLNSPQYVHLVAEISKRVFADRAEYLGDADYSEIPVARLLDADYLRRRAAEVERETITPAAGVRPGLRDHAPGQGRRMTESPETTHFSVVDKWGNAVSNTYTLNYRYGSGVVVEGAGFLLNGSMDDFPATPGVANSQGLVTGALNALAPGKRPLSSMTPTILTRNGKIALVIGTPGSSRIFPILFQVLTNLYRFQMPLEKALAEMRFHLQLIPEDTIFWEPLAAMDGPLAEALQTRGYVLEASVPNGDVQVIQVEGRTVTPLSDPRGLGAAIVVPLGANLPGHRDQH